jgi:hypothetical protein
VPLRLATVAVNQLGNRTARKANVRPLGESPIMLRCRHDNARGYEFLVSARPTHACTRRNEFGNDAPVSRNRHPLGRLPVQAIRPRLFTFPPSYFSSNSALKWS